MNIKYIIHILFCNHIWWKNVLSLRGKNCIEWSNGVFFNCSFKPSIIWLYYNISMHHTIC